MRLTVRQIENQVLSLARFARSKWLAVLKDSDWQVDRQVLQCASRTLACSTTMRLE
jgi:hypothetical protein